MDGDPDMIYQVMYNLIENAVKFTNEGGYIAVGLRELDDRTVVSIRNSGAGIRQTRCRSSLSAFIRQTSPAAR